MRDPYTILGVGRSASEKDIKGAFRKLAKKYHPDQNPDNPKAKERFAQVNSAYEIIGDKKKRRQFDAGEIDAEGKPKMEGFPGGDPFSGFRRQGQPGGNPFGGRQSQGVNPEDIFGDLFGNMAGGAGGFKSQFNDMHGFNPASGAGGRPRARPARETHVNLTLSVDNLARGKAKVILPDGRTVAVSIPPEPKPGQKIRLRGQGQSQPGIGQSDLVITLDIKPKPPYLVEGANLIVNAPLPLETAVNGGKLPVQTPDGKISLTIPAWTDSGKTFRLKGRGLPAAKGGHGDLLVKTVLKLPEKGMQGLKTLLEDIKA